MVIIITTIAAHQIDTNSDITSQLRFKASNGSKVEIEVVVVANSFARYWDIETTSITTMLALSLIARPRLGSRSIVHTHVVLVAEKETALHCSPP